MSERDYWDEESFQQYKESLIKQKNEMDAQKYSLHIKILSEMIEALPEKYSDYFEEK